MVRAHTLDLQTTLDWTPVSFYYSPSLPPGFKTRWGGNSIDLSVDVFDTNEDNMSKDLNMGKVAKDISMIKGEMA